MNLKSIILFVFATLIVMGCGKKINEEEKHTSQAAENYTKSEDSSTESLNNIGVDSIRNNRKTFFHIPKNIDKDLFVVAFYNEVNESQEAIIYNDSKKNSASKITYFDDGTTTESKLVPESDGSFREIYDEFPEDRPHYVVYPAQVKFIHTNGSVGAIFQVLDSN